MATNYPVSLQDLDATRGTDSQSLDSPNHVTHHTLEDDTIEALQAKVGIDGSAVSTSLDYQVNNSLSISPGHLHQVADFSDYAPISSSTGVSDANKVVKTDPEGKIDDSFLREDIQVFTSSGTWTKPSLTGLSKARIEIWGAGGSGGASCAIHGNNNRAAAGGGGSGAYKRFLVDLDDLGATESVTIGAGGASVNRSTHGFTNGNAGGATSFGSTFSVEGGDEGLADIDDENETAAGGSGGDSGTDGVGYDGAAGGTGNTVTDGSYAGGSGIWSAGGGSAGAKTDEDNNAAGGSAHFDGNGGGDGASNHGSGNDATADAGDVACGGGGAAVSMSSGSATATSGAGGDGYCRVTVF